MVKHVLIFSFGFSFYFSQSQVVFNGSASAFVAGANTLTFSKTVAAGNNRLIYVAVGVQSQNTSITGVTWNGLALTQFTQSNVASASSRGAIYYRALGSSATPTTANVVVSIGSNKDLSAGAADFSGVWQAAPIVNETVSSGNNRFPSITFSSSAGNIAVSMMSSVAGSVTATAGGQTVLWSIGGAFPCASSIKAGAASVSMSHTIASSDKWIMIGGTIQDHALLLPIELTEFNARCHSNNYSVFWKTATEKTLTIFCLNEARMVFYGRKSLKLRQKELVLPKPIIFTEIITNHTLNCIIN